MSYFKQVKCAVHQDERVDAIKYKCRVQIKLIT